MQQVSHTFDNVDSLGLEGTLFFGLEDLTRTDSDGMTNSLKGPKSQRSLSLGWQALWAVL